MLARIRRKQIFATTGTALFLLHRNGVAVEVLVALLALGLLGTWVYARYIRTSPPPNSDTLLGAYEPPPPPRSEEVLKTQWLTKRELGILAAVALVGGILFLTRDKGGTLHVVASGVYLLVDSRAVLCSVERYSASKGGPAAAG
ncbi:hypothetical protein [Myxococcus sp. Y35]|uniref:hypothetical protein n=1 Tax=Pseudomyxococcus flavus TaxID=3115648 RepID=UPI003CF5F55E